MQCLVIGGGLSGLSAAHTALQNGLSVCLLDKNPFMGGNSTKATSGINGAGSKTQAKLSVADSAQVFYEDTVRSATGIKKGPLPDNAWYDLAKVLTYESADSVHWIQECFGLALDTTSRLGGHSYPRTHRSKKGGKFPGMEITYTLMQEYERLAEAEPNRVRLETRAKVTELLTCPESGRITGVKYEQNGQVKTINGDTVVIATGGYGAGIFSAKSLLNKVRPDIYEKFLPTTNGKHCTGDGIELAMKIGAGTVGLDDVQVHPTGLVNPLAPNERTLFLAAGALRGEGGIILDRDGKRFCNDLGTRDYVTGRMWEHNKAPYRLVLNSKCASNIAWHCSHYCGRKVMQKFSSGQEVAKFMGIDANALKSTFDDYNRFEKEDSDPWGKPASFYRGTPWRLDDEFHVATVTPVVHYTMGGLLIDSDAAVLYENSKKPIPGLYCAGECAGGVHGRNRLGGSALLECVVFGRKAGKSLIKYINDHGFQSQKQQSVSSSTVTINIPQENGSSVVVTISTNGSGNAVVSRDTNDTSSSSVKKSDSEKTLPVYSLDDIAKHNTDDDCWVAVNGQVLDVTSFLEDHPGGKMAIMTFAGRDASHEFNMLHDANVVKKYAPHCIIGTLKTTSKL